MKWYKYFFKIIKQAAGQNIENKGPSIQEYINRGKIRENHEIVTYEDNSYEKQQTNFEQIYHQYLKLREDGFGHSISWDSIKAHSLPIELQMQLRERIKNDNPQFYREAENELNYIEALLHMKKKNASTIDKAKELKAMGMPPDIIQQANSIIIKNKMIRYLLLNEFADTSELFCKTIKKANKYRKLCVIGVPSKARTKICERLSSFYNVPHLDIKKMLEKTIELGVYEQEQVQDILNNVDKINPKLVEILFHIVNDSLDGFILEGYPIKDETAETLDVDAVVYLDEDIKNKVEVFSNRRWCPTCFYLYHLKTYPPTREDGKCDRCGSILTIRPEDVPEAIRSKYYTWKKDITELVRKLRKLNKIIELNIDNNSEEASRIIDRILSGKYHMPTYKDEYVEKQQN